MTLSAFTQAYLDLEAAANRLGETFKNGRLTLKMLGKDVTVAANGDIYTDIHVHGSVCAGPYGRVDIAVE